jgi:hypothetical protein
MRAEKLRANLPLFMGRTDRRGKFALWQKKRFSIINTVKAINLQMSPCSGVPIPMSTRKSFVALFHLIIFLNVN